MAAAVAAYGSSGLVEESAQDGELEARVERHVICARASGNCGVSASRRLVHGLCGSVAPQPTARWQLWSRLWVCLSDRFFVRARSVRCSLMSWLDQVAGASWLDQLARLEETADVLV